MIDQKSRILLGNYEEVDHPSHYTVGGMEPIDYMKIKMKTDEYLGFLKGNVIKYISRAGLKNDEMSDLKKAQFYLNRLIEEKG